MDKPNWRRHIGRCDRPKVVLISLDIGLESHHKPLHMGGA